MSEQNKLHVFSAGAVAPPIKKCAEEFKAKFGTEFEFTVRKAARAQVQLYKRT
jgi:ABC-type molybdate transport system substrate-binding protein